MNRKKKKKKKKKKYIKEQFTGTKLMYRLSLLQVLVR